LTVLDYGCGEGSNINYLIKNYKYDCYGVDISAPSIKICHKKYNKKKFKLISSEINKNDKFFNVKFDLIISIQTLYYLNKPDLKLRLANLNSMLKPGGYVFFTMKSIKSDY
jgi:cyclopropane fatty-acyl-phospholipid synthase-like methyltransferase